MSRPIARIIELVRTRLPVRAACSEVSLARPADEAVRIDEHGSLFAALRLAVFEWDEPTVIRDVKEQEVWLGDLSKHPEARWLAYLEGHLRALPGLLDRRGEDVDALLPVDVVGYPEALADASLVTADDFARALSDWTRVDGWHEARARAEWEEALAGCGLAGRAEEVRALERASIRLHLDRVEDDDEDDDADAGVGTTRVGGAPDLPPSMPWPEVEGEPLMFVAQLDLASLAELPAAAELPRTGLLSFFYSPGTIEGVPGNPVRVLHLPDTASLVRRSPPEDVERVIEHDADTTSERMFPPVESPFYEALLPETTQRAFRRSLRAAGRGEGGPVIDPLARIGWVIADYSGADPERPVHRVLGYASSIQGDPYVDIEVAVVRGGFAGWEDDSDEAIGLRASARRWRLLLQIDASGDGELLLNQDGGFFYFWIPDDALAVHDWSQVRGSLQCH